MERVFQTKKVLGGTLERITERHSNRLIAIRFSDAENVLMYNFRLKTISLNGVTTFNNRGKNFDFKKLENRFDNIVKLKVDLDTSKAILKELKNKGV